MCIRDRLGSVGMNPSMTDDDEEESEPAVGATSMDGDTASATAGETLQEFNVDMVVSMLDDMGYTTRKTDGDEGPVLILDAGSTGATDLRMEFLCNDFTEKCYDLVVTATYATKKPASLKAINAWNREYRWTRAYLDDKNQAVLQMDMNAEGGIGKNNLQILINTYFSITEDFAKTLTAAPAK